MATEEPFFRIERRDGVVVLTRTARSFESLEEVEEHYGAVVAELDRLPRSRLPILVDLRQAPARNDPAFERAIKPLRKRIFAGFARAAVLVRSAAGKLQVQRHGAEDGERLEVFTSLEEALSALAR